MIEKIQKLNYLIEERIVRGRNNGKRAYIHYNGAEYRSTTLSSGDTYVGHKITLLVNPRDIRTVEAYDERGRYIGILKAYGEYGTKSHSLKTRKLALQHARERGRDKAEFDTPISALRQHLDKQAKKSKRAATRGDIVRRETGAPLPSEQKKNTEITVEPFITNRKYSEQNDLSNMPTAEEADRMTSKELIERMWAGGKKT